MTHENHDFNRNVFINCPFDPDYKPMLRALLLTVIECGLEPRIATESGDSGEVRVQKIENLIRESRYSIHDISRIEPLTESQPRLRGTMNTPLTGKEKGLTGYWNFDDSTTTDKTKYRN